MALSLVDYTGDGATTDFAIPFNYILQEHVEVLVDGTPTSAWSFVGASTVRFDTAPALDADIRIQRDSGISSRLVDFQDASVLTADELDQDSNQLFYLLQEREDTVASTEQSTITTNFDGILSSDDDTVQKALDTLDDGTATAAQGALADSAIQPGDGAGGVLLGTFPNPGFAQDMATQAELDAVAAAKANLSHTHNASEVVSGAFADARISATSVTQHNAALDHDALANFSADEHRQIIHDVFASRPAAGTSGRSGGRRARPAPRRPAPRPETPGGSR